MLEACDGAFGAADVDHSGTLSHKEFAVLVKRITGDAASAKMLKKLLRLIDVNASGFVELEEFLRFAAPLEDGDGDRVSVGDLEARISTMAAAHRQPVQNGATTLQHLEA